MNPKELLLKLCEKFPRQKKTLEAVYEICCAQVDSGSTDFSYVTISRLGIGRGVPKVQSIRNKTGENYQILIKCFSSSSEARKRAPKTNGGDAWAEDIVDPKLRFLAQATLSELAEAKRTIREFVPPGSFIKVDDRSSTAPEFRLSNIERRSIEHLLTDDFLKQWNLERGDKGEILDTQGKVIFKPGTIQALQKALKFL